MASEEPLAAWTTSIRTAERFHRGNCALVVRFRSQVRSNTVQSIRGQTICCRHTSQLVGQEGSNREHLVKHRSCRPYDLAVNFNILHSYRLATSSKALISTFRRWFGCSLLTDEVKDSARAGISSASLSRSWASASAFAEIKSRSAKLQHEETPGNFHHVPGKPEGSPPSPSPPSQSPPWPPPSPSSPSPSSSTLKLEIFPSRRESAIFSSVHCGK